MLAAVADRYPARQYVIVDDKLRILTMVKRIWGHRVTTVFARQGHYALLPGAEPGPRAVSPTVVDSGPARAAARITPNPGAQPARRCDSRCFLVRVPTG